MILVDSSAWIASLRDQAGPVVEKLRLAVATEPVLVGDLVLLEVLQGARDERHAARIERALRQYEIVSLLDAGLAARAARLYRMLRAKGITVRKTIDLVIASYCLEHDHVLLHDDRDFQPFVEYFGLRTL